MSKESFYPLILLLIPLFIMNITDEVDWSLLDFFYYGVHDSFTWFYN